MSSNYTGLGVQLMTTGEKAGTWGTLTNTNWEIIEQIAGVPTLNVACIPVNGTPSSRTGVPRDPVIAIPPSP